MKNIIDIHCHIIPDVDDGSKNMGESLSMLKIAVENGVSSIIATPHYHPVRGKVSQEEIAHRFSDFKREVRSLGIPIELYLGSEVFYTSDTPEDLEKDRLYTLAGSRYLLVEFMPDVRLAILREAVNEINLQGKIPILAHIERYAVLTEDGEKIEELIEMGCLMQVNMMTLNGIYGKSIQKHAIKWVKQDMVHFIASDSHSNRTRAPRFREGMEKLCKKLGEAAMERLLIENPGKILKDDDIT